MCGRLPIIVISVVLSANNHDPLALCMCFFFLRFFLTRRFFFAGLHTTERILVGFFVVTLLASLASLVAPMSAPG